MAWHAVHDSAFYEVFSLVQFMELESETWTEFRVSAVGLGTAHMGIIEAKKVAKRVKKETFRLQGVGGEEGEMGVN